MSQDKENVNKTQAFPGFSILRLFIKLSFFVYGSVMGRSKPAGILITERLRKP